MAPAGDFQSAYQALTHGADAVYLGLQEFSARKAAKNFSLDEVRRIVQFAHERGQAVYLAMNTLVKEAELTPLIELLHHVSLLGTDGIIVQDLGLARVIKEHFPSLKLHGSTQVAVHNASGVRFLQGIGFTRVVLARELTMQEISSIREECPDVELKIFIHGALCYSISGMCLASGMILGRSGNRGACGQICRTFSEVSSKDGAGPYGYYFSMKDLSLNERVRELQEIGIDSLKIEGRMKSPSYTAGVSAMYRAILDGKKYDPDRADLAFSRVSAAGWAGEYHRPDRDDHDTSLVNPSFSGHTGIKAGVITGRDRGAAVIRTSCPLAVRDGVQLLKDDANLPGIQKAIPFSISSMKDRKGRPITSCRKGDIISIPVSEPVTIGETLYKISGHDSDMKLVNPLSVSPYSYPLTTEITIGKDSLSLRTGIPAIEFECSHEVSLLIDEAKAPRPVGGILEQAFCVSDPGLPFHTEAVTVKNHSTYPDDEIFIPPKQLKQARRAWQAKLKEQFDSHVKERSASLAAECRNEGRFVSELPKRSLINADGYVTDDSVYLPLPPVQFSEQDFTRIDRKLERLRTAYPGKRIIVGISNIGQVEWYTRQDSIACFIDYHLYCANSQTAVLFSGQLHDCIGAYYWIEDRDQPVQRGYDSWGIPLSYIDADFNPPIFITRTCFRKDSLGQSCSTCRGRSYDYELEQKGRDFLVEVRDCMSYVYVKKP